MPRIRTGFRMAVAAFAAAALCACANLAAVRDFASQSSSIAGYVATTNFMVANPDRLMASVPSIGLFDPDRDALQQAASDRARVGDSMLKIHAVVTGYMGALAGLAGDQAFSISGGVAQVQGALVAAPDLGIDADSVNAYASIASTVTNWIAEAIQEKEVKSMVTRHGPAMDVLLGALVQVSQASEQILEQDQKKMASYGALYENAFRTAIPAGNAAPTDAQMRSDAVFMVVRRTDRAALAEQAAAIDSAKAVADAARKIRDGHADLLKNIDHLQAADVIARLQQITLDLRSLRVTLKTL